MRSTILVAGTLTGLVFAPPATRADDKPDYTEITRRIHRIIVARMPKQFEDRAEWGKTVPLPPGVRFPRLRRNVIKVGNHYEVPQGVWKRTKVWIVDPNRDLQIRITDTRKIGKDTTRLHVEATVVLRGARERKRWANGVQLFGITADADAVVAIGLDCDVKVSLDFKKLPPELRVEPKVVRAQLALKQFKLRRVGPVLVREQSDLGEELKRTLQERLRTYEPRVKEYANKAIAELFKDGKGLLPPPSRPKPSLVR